MPRTSGDLLLLSPVSGGELGDSGIFGDRLAAHIEESQTPDQISVAPSHWLWKSLAPGARRFDGAYERPAREGAVRNEQFGVGPLLSSLLDRRSTIVFEMFGTITRVRYRYHRFGVERYTSSRVNKEAGSWLRRRCDNEADGFDCQVLTAKTLRPAFMTNHGNRTITVCSSLTPPVTRYQFVLFLRISCLELALSVTSTTFI